MPFKNTVGKGEIAPCEQFLFFPQCFLPVFWELSATFIKFWICRLPTLSTSKSLKFVVWERVSMLSANALNLYKAKILSSVNPFSNKPRFLRVFSTCLLKTLREKEKLLLTCNFSFSHSVFYPFFGNFCAIFIKYEFVLCQPFLFGRVQNWSFGKGLTYTTQARFWLPL